MHTLTLFEERNPAITEKTFACGAWSAVPFMTQAWLNATDFVCVTLCVFCSVITQQCCSFTLDGIDTPV